MRDNKRSATFHKSVHRPLNDFFRAGIDAARRFVQNKHRRVFYHCSCDSEQLFLSLRQTAFVVEHGVVTFWQRLYKVVESDGFARRDYFFFRNVGFAVTNVVKNGSFKYPRILQHHTKQIVNVLSRQVGERNAVNGDFPRVEFVKPHKKVYYRGFARARRSDDCYFLSRLYFGVKPVNYHLLRVVPKHDVFKFHVAFYFVKRANRVVGRHFFRFQKLKHAFARRRHRLKRRRCLRYLRQRVCKVADINHKRNDNSQLDVSVDCQRTADNAHHHVPEVAHKPHDGLHKSADKLTFPRRRV